VLKKKGVKSPEIKKRRKQKSKSGEPCGPRHIVGGGVSLIG
jgi:hypothetical protein